VTRGRRDAAFFAAVAILAVAAIAHGVHLGWGYVAGTVWGEPLLQPSGPHLVWSPYIHPPLYAEFLIVLWWAADVFDTDPQYYIYLYAAVVAGGLCVVLGLWVRARFGATMGVLAAGLMALSPNSLRPYEEYPLMKGVLVVVALLTAGYVRRGGRGWAVAAVLAGLVAAELHLSAWFVIGPLFAGIFFTIPGRRRGIAVASVAVIGLFLLTTWPGLYEVLAGGPDQGPDWVTPPWRETVTLEWTNPCLFAPLLLWLHPAVRAAAPEGGVLALGAIGYVVITLGLQIAGLAIGGWGGLDSHHYFELVDGVLILAAVTALAAAVEVSKGWKAHALRFVGLALLGTQVALFLSRRAELVAAMAG
jgi:hypothetical protein